MKYDLIVIGGGASGMFSAIIAGRRKLSVLLLEKNKELGLKLLITGKGRCNLTHYELDNRRFLSVLEGKAKYLYSVFSKFNVESTIKFFNDRGLKTKIERGNRVFPVSDKAVDVRNLLIKELNLANVKVQTSSFVKDIIFKNNKIVEISIEKNGKKFFVKADKYILATGGKSFPGTGSTGDFYEILKKFGHSIINPIPALVPIILEEKFIKQLEGLSLKNVNISIWHNNKKMKEEFGEAIFTDKGMSGPIILKLSKFISENLDKKLFLKIDFKPALDYKVLNQRLLKEFKEHSNKSFKTVLKFLLPNKLIDIAIDILKIDANKKLNLISKEERKKILKFLKSFQLTIKDTEGFYKAVITAGGVDLDEIDFQTMRSKIIENLYIVGEILDLDAPTGGYNLQIAWSTGYVAGISV